MKTKTLLMGMLITVLAGGCMSDTYGPASSDYYPIDAPPFSANSAPGAPAFGKVSLARLAPPALVPAPAAGVKTEAAL
jgi:hypothetical protein